MIAVKEDGDDGDAEDHDEAADNDDNGEDAALARRLSQEYEVESIGDEAWRRKQEMADEDMARRMQREFMKERATATERETAEKPLSQEFDWDDMEAFDSRGSIFETVERAGGVGNYVRGQSGAGDHVISSDGNSGDEDGNLGRGMSQPAVVTPRPPTPPSSAQSEQQLRKILFGNVRNASCPILLPSQRNLCVGSRV